ncbi:hypothetical protein TOPH_03093 [Tolypocladium ophioglossoides CBS 100239]|uniref:Uncharacterized protein n=1 Tax=Tolypocladium ophioglossoides (strain CBS 100239) TaxID=1163406 RepID=A0A0L0NDN1_TOLOC|nr:hypothetical protein TOPH_03093 [Tolypocladium ophioglossoides CBS 100239]
MGSVAPSRAKYTGMSHSPRDAAFPSMAGWGTGARRDWLRAGLVFSGDGCDSAGLGAGAGAGQWFGGLWSWAANEWECAECAPDRC